ncbi:MAG TPA: MarR family transcriptional regulator [Longimicrobiaceae bacterium]
MSDAAVMFHTAMAAKLGLGPSDWKTLGLLERYGPQTAGELAERSGLARPSVTGILDRLERGGWLRRERDPEDGRRVVVRLDEAAARSFIGAYFEGLARRLEGLYARYDDSELELLLEFMREVARRQTEATAELEGLPE